MRSLATIFLIVPYTKHLINEVRPNLEFFSKLGISIESGDFSIDIRVAFIHLLR